MRPEPRQFEAIVLGAGAAGLMCAATAGQRGRRVALLEYGGQAGRKILISGGGRCNFTNLHCGPENFISENMHFAKSALAGFRPADFIALVDRYGIAWHEKTLGQLFCDGSSRAILDMLLAECALGGVELVLNSRGITVESHGAHGFRVSCSAGTFEAQSVVVATGGLSIPKMGATGLGSEIAVQFGLSVVAGAGSAGAGRRRGAMDGAGGGGDGSGGFGGQSALSGKDAGYASRLEWAGGVAGFFVLAGG